MEDQSTTTITVQTAAKRKNLDFEPPPDATQVQPYDPAAGPRPPGTYDPNDPPGNGKLRH